MTAAPFTATTAPASGRATAPAIPARTAEHARMAWVTASRDTELDLWRELYDLAVAQPRADVRAAA